MVQLPNSLAQRSQWHTNTITKKTLKVASTTIEIQDLLGSRSDWAILIDNDPPSKEEDLGNSLSQTLKNTLISTYLQ